MPRERAWLAGAAALLAACSAPSTRASSPPTPAAVRRSTVLTDADFAGQRVSRVEELFAGRFAGVEVLAAPNGMRVRIRGRSTIYGNSEPLFVLDGMPMISTGGGLVAINPLDVAKIEVLKDAASTAIYGVRGANGVILITTKR